MEVSRDRIGIWSPINLQAPLARVELACPNERPSRTHSMFNLRSHGPYQELWIQGLSRRQHDVGVDKVLAPVKWRDEVIAPL